MWIRYKNKYRKALDSTRSEGNKRQMKDGGEDRRKNSVLILSQYIEKINDVSVNF